jgi:hypothetical protein
LKARAATAAGELSRAGVCPDEDVVTATNIAAQTARSRCLVNTRADEAL